MPQDARTVRRYEPPRHAAQWMREHGAELLSKYLLHRINGLGQRGLGDEPLVTARNHGKVTCGPRCSGAAL
ncbi:hypothetical protein K7395_24630 [Streptomyces filamentosus]|uniref:Uncharacterized protein n=1 Tax=Streptomyces filamentosus TaxID=67294 RepID=A0ABY4UZD5_STRFL|nr:MULTISPECIES: hypothetical protein [Streptomyces]USC49675.1 hypothetical protein K7395_24630 [Streptomyces filamentosus]